MSHNLFDVFLTGRLLDGHNRREVIVNLAQLTGSSLPQATALLDGAVRMKTGVDQPTAGMYHEVLEETGAEAVVQACIAFSTVVATVPTLPTVAPPAPVDAAVTRHDPASLIQPEATPHYDGLDPDPLDITQPFSEPPPVFVPRRSLPRWPWLVGVGLACVLLAALPWWLQRPSVTANPPEVGRQSVVGETLNRAQPFQQQVDQFWQQQGRFPLNLAELGHSSPPLLDNSASLTLGAEGRLLLIFTSGSGALAGSTLELIPRPANAGIEWQCSGGTLPAAARPAECQ